MAWGNNNQGPWGGGPQKPVKPPLSGGGGGNKMPPPPDLDELFRKGQDGFKKMFPGDGNNSRILGLVFVGLLAFWAASGIYFVKADEQGVVTRFGKYHRTDQPGMNYHLPYPIERVQTPRVTSVNRVEVGFSSNARSNSGVDESAMLTGDENIVDVNFEVQWKIMSAPDFLFNVRNPEDTVRTVAQSAMREVVGKTTIVTVLSEGAGKLQVEQHTKKLMQEMLNNYKAGVEVVAVNLLKADPPTQVLDAFRDVQSARADMETARNQAEAYRNDIIPRARGEAEKLVLDAEAYKQEVVARAQGEASRFVSVYNEFKQAKDVTKKRMYLETMEDILQGMNKVIMDGKNNVLPYMALPPLNMKKEEEKAP